MSFVCMMLTLNFERNRDHCQENNPISSLVLARSLNIILDLPLHNLTNTRSLKPFYPGRFLGVLEVGPGNLGKDIQVLTLHRNQYCYHFLCKITSHVNS